MTEINGYQLLGELTTNNAGFCRWGFCRKNGHKYFIKEFLDPVYPPDRGSLSVRTLARKREICDEFYKTKKAFYDELSKCRTGNVEIIISFFRFGSKYYAISDMVDSKKYTIADVAKSSQKIKETFIRAILYSFEQLHRNGIVHSDVKPDNMIVTKTPKGYYTAKIIDFDAGFLASCIPEEIQGDFVYLAPEAYRRMNGEEINIDQKIDVFALGILFHQYWSNSLPQTDKEYNYIFEAVLDDSEVIFSKSIPKDFLEIIKKMLSKNPEDRPSVSEILEFFRKNDAPQTDTVVSSGTVPDNQNIKIKDDKNVKPASSAAAPDDQTHKSELFFVPKDLG